MNWSQLRTVLWLRWCLTRNQWARTGKLNAVITLIVTIFGILLGFAGGIAGILFGAFSLGTTDPLVLLLVYDGLLGLFLLFWTIGVVTELQRAEAIDLGRLLHLPISLRGIFFVNYLASHLTLSAALFVPGMIGLSLGLAWSKGPAMLWLIPLTLGTLAMITAWTYCLRGWLITLMVNQRRRRTVIVAITLGFMLLTQLPNLYFNLLRPPRERPQLQQTPSPETAEVAPPKPPPKFPPGFLTAHKFVPFMWAPYGALELARENAWPAIAGALGAWLLGGLGLARSYRSTMRFYLGGESVKPAKRKPQPALTGKLKPSWVEKNVPGLPEEASVLSWVFLRSLTRAPEFKMALAMNVIVLGVLAFSMFTRDLKSPPPNLKPFLATGVIGFQCMGLLQTMMNLFGFDRDGFRALVLLPVKRQYILLAKNMALVPVAFGGGLLFLAILTVLTNLSPAVLLASILQLISAFLMFSVLGNLISTVFPYRIAIGSLKPTKVPGLNKFMLFLTHSLFPLLLIPIFIPPLAGLVCEEYGGIPAGFVNLMISGGLALVAGVIYGVTLQPIGNLLQRREKDVLRVVTTEVE